MYQDLATSNIHFFAESTGISFLKKYPTEKIEELEIQK